LRDGGWGEAHGAEGESSSHLIAHRRRSTPPSTGFGICDMRFGIGDVRWGMKDKERCRAHRARQLRAESSEGGAKECILPIS